MFSSMISLGVHRLLSFYQIITLPIWRYLQPLYTTTLKTLPIIAAEAVLWAYFRYCDLSPCTVDLDDGQTSMHIWTANHRRCNKPNLVIVHGFGGNSKWQFVLQVAQLARDFNVYIPDLLFFGKSHSNRPERTVTFQAECISEGLKRVGVEKFSVYAISYGGFVAYEMAETREEMVEKLVIVSSGIVFTEHQKLENLKKIGRNVLNLFVPERTDDVRALCRLTMYNSDASKWFPDFFLRGFIDLDGWKKEKRELLEDLLFKKLDVRPPILNQETLIIWGDKDLIFPLHMAYELHRHLGPKSKLEIVKDAGHAANIEAADSLNQLITRFVLGNS